MLTVSRIAIHHDGLNAFVPQRHGGVHAAIVEFDALSDPVGASAEDDHLLPAGRARLAFSSIGGIQIGVCASNSAAQVSTRLYVTDRAFFADRAA